MLSRCLIRKRLLHFISNISAAEGLQPDWMYLHGVWFQPAFLLLVVVDRQEFWRPKPSFLLEQAAL